MQLHVYKWVCVYGYICIHTHIFTVDTFFWDLGFLYPHEQLLRWDVLEVFPRCAYVCMHACMYVCLFVCM